MPRPQPRQNYRVAVGLAASMIARARTPGAAARIAFRQFIAARLIRRQPRTEPGGSWEHTSIELAP